MRMSAQGGSGVVGGQGFVRVTGEGSAGLTRGNQLNQKNLLSTLLPIAGCVASLGSQASVLFRVTLACLLNPLPPPMMCKTEPA